MAPRLSQFLNRTILVSIPSLFVDGKCRPYKLAGIELYGLWLEGGDLASRLLPDQIQTTAVTAVTAFVPFSQIASVVVAIANPASPSSSTTTKDQNGSPGNLDPG